MALPLLLFAVAGIAVLTIGAGFMAKPIVKETAEGIKVKSLAEAEKIKQPTTETHASNILGGLYQSTGATTSGLPGEGGKNNNASLEALGGGLGGQPKVSVNAGVDTTSGATPTGTATADTGNAFGSILSGFMPTFQLIVIGIFAFLIIKEVI